MPDTNWFDPEDPPEDFVVQDMKALEFMAYPNLPRQLLYMDGLREWHNLPELANRWLTELADVGLLELDPGEEAPIKQADYRRPTMAPTVDPRGGKLYPVRVEGHRQTFWLQVDARPPYGDKSEYKPIKVLDKFLRTQTAIISLLTALEATPMDQAKLRQALSEAKSPLRDSLPAYEFGYVLSLLRYYRPSFDELPHEEQLGLVEEACKRVNKSLEASRHLVEFLEYGRPNRDLRPAIENANQDVRAAVLRALEGLSSPKSPSA